MDKHDRNLSSLERGSTNQGSMLSTKAKASNHSERRKAAQHPHSAIEVARYLKHWSPGGVGGGRWRKQAQHLPFLTWVNILTLGGTNGVDNYTRNMNLTVHASGV